MRVSLMWSLVYEAREGLIAPVTRNWYFSAADPNNFENGDENYVLFCW